MLPITPEKLHQIYKSCNNLICTDTRNIIPGSLFFCLKGGNFNGNLFAAEALEKGAAFVVADQTDVCVNDRILFVNDTLTALQELAHFHREHIDTQILAIGGSNGKTTTKELCLSVLGTSLKVKATRGNLNNHIGVPLTLLELDGTEDVAIVEMGTNHPGEMKVLCDIALADAGIVTNVGKEHLEGFGSMEAIAREESELYLSLLQENGKALVNADDTWLANMGKRMPDKITFGIHAQADIQGVVHASMPFLRFSIETEGKTYGPWEAKIGGTHNLYNILAAVGAGKMYGIDTETAAKAACAYVPGNNRSEWKTLGRVQVLMDAYNANPSSMELALREFAGIPGSKTVCLGDMLELGAHSETEHAAIFRLAQNLGFERVYFSGPEFQRASGNHVFAFPHTAALAEYLNAHPVDTEFLLLKGSRGMRMESLLLTISQAG